MLSYINFRNVNILHGIAEMEKNLEATPFDLNQLCWSHRYPYLPLYLVDQILFVVGWGECDHLKFLLLSYQNGVEVDFCPVPVQLFYPVQHLQSINIICDDKRKT